MSSAATTTSTPSSGTTSSTGSTSSTSSTNPATNQFLQILLTELQNQNPLNPTDTATFTTQLAQYSSLEQQIDTNTKLDTLISNSTAAAVSPVAYLGTTVDYNSTTAPVQNGAASWSYSTSNAASVTISVTDAAGDVLYTGDGDSSAGIHTLNLTTGSTVPDGTPLTISVTAKDSTGASVTPTVTSRANVDAVDTANGAVTLEASGFAFDSTKVTRVAQTITASSTGDTGDTSGTGDTSDTNS